MSKMVDPEKTITAVKPEDDKAYQAFVLLGEALPRLERAGELLELSKCDDHRVWKAYPDIEYLATLCSLAYEVRRQMEHVGGIYRALSSCPAEQPPPKPEHDPAYWDYRPWNFDNSTCPKVRALAKAERAAKKKAAMAAD